MLEWKYISLKRVILGHNLLVCDHENNMVNFFLLLIFLLLFALHSPQISHPFKAQTGKGDTTKELTQCKQILATVIERQEELNQQYQAMQVKLSLTPPPTSLHGIGQ